MPVFRDWADTERPPEEGGGGGLGGGLGDLGSGPLGSVVDARPIEYARILDLVSEGPIEGLVDGLKSVFLDDTPVQNSDNSLNFSGLILQSVKGTGTQAPIPGFPSAETETSVTTKVSIAGGPVTRTISTAGVSAVRVKIKVPALKVINTSNGKESGTTVLFKVEIQAASYNSGVWTRVKLDGDDYWGKITGKFGTPYTRSYRIPLPSAGPWQVRVTRLTVDAPDAYTQNETWWDSYTELTDARLCYPHSALFALEVDSQQFRSIPRRAYEIKGRIVKVPSNYDPATRVYTGIWNGTFKDAWTDNPAWVWYDLATNTRYGAGNYLDATLIDKWTLYQCAQYCDEMVDNGRGGTEPRFACNLYLQTQEEAIRVLTNLLGVFRAMAYEAGGTIVPVQDAPSDPVAIFTNSNVRDGAFTYSGTSRRQRHTAALVGWNDPNDGYRLVPEVVEDQAGIARYGYQPMEATALGCTSQGQARRYGLWLLASEMTETESVTFAAALEGAAVAPGEVIQINDQHRAGFSRWGGRIVSATTTAVTLDAPVTLGAGSYALKCTLPDGTVESRTVTGGAGTRSTLTVGTAYSQAPGAQAQWLLMDSAVTPRLYRVVSVGEGDGLEHEILAVEHNPAKYAAVESGLTLGPGVSGGPRAFPPVTGLALSSSVEVHFGARVMHLEAKWNPTAGATGYRAVASRDNGPWEAMEISAATARLWGAEEGSYRVRVVAVYPSGVSTYTEASATVSESTAVPSGLGSAAGVTQAQSTANAAAAAAAAAASQASAALSAAATAQSTADGKIDSFYQASAPGSASEGDLWFDTDDGNKVYRWTSGAWVAAADSGIAAALSAAATAQGTADGKARIYYQTSAPGGLGAGDQGDLWVDTDDNNKLWAWNGSSWIVAQDWYAANAAAAAAQGTANTAASAASAAQSSANTANAALADISSDGKLTPVEKQRARLEWDTILAERSGIQSQADTFGVSRTAYDSAFQALANYLNAGSTWSSGAPSWLSDANLGVTTDISGATFRANWQALYDARQALLNAIADKARLNAAAAQSTANSASSAASSAQSTANSAASAAAYADALARSSYNLIKNGNSELANPTGPEALWVTEGYAYQGTKKRSSNGAVNFVWGQVTDFIPCAEGESFAFEAMTACDPGGIRVIVIDFLDSAKNWLCGAYSGQRPSDGYIDFGASSYRKQSVSGVAPTGACWVRFLLGAKGDGIPSAFDCLYATRKISAGMLQGDAIQTTNYAEDGSGNPTAGARMDISGTALKVMPGGLQVGTYTFTDYFWRIMQALDGASGTKVLYRGNNDTGTRGGAPDIARLTVTRRRWNTTDHVCRLELKIQPQAGSDNLDAMRAAEVQLYRQNTAGDIAAITLVDTYYPAITDRYYRSTTDSNAANAVRITFETVDPAIIFGCPAALVTLFNAYGPSAGNCFYAGAGNADGSDLVNSGTSWPTGITGGVDGDIGGGTGDLGGGCPAPWVKVQLASGLLVEAGDLYDGVQVAAVREQDMEPTVGTLREVRTIWAERVAVVLEDGRVPEFSRGHRLATIDRGWVAVQDLRPGELLVAQQESRVKAVRCVGLGQVVTFRVIGAGTYFADGILNHNEKVPL